MRVCLFSIAITVISSLLVLPAEAGFIIEVDPAASLRTPPGPLEVPILIKHDGDLLSSFNGLQIKIADTSGVQVRQVDISDRSPFQIANVNANKELGLTDVFTNIGFTSAFAPLVTLIFDASEVGDHTINLQFVEATQAGDTIFDPQIPLAASDFSIQPNFVITVVPEPSGALLLCLLSTVGAAFRRPRRKGSA